MSREGQDFDFPDCFSVKEKEKLRRILLKLVEKTNNKMDSIITWIKSQTTYCAGRSTTVLNQLLDLQERCNLFEDCPVTLLLQTGNAVVELNHHLRVSLVTLCEIAIVEDLRELIRYIGKLDPPATQPLNWKSSAAENLINHTLRLKMEFQRTEAVNSLTEGGNLPTKIHNQLTTDLEHLKPHERDRIITITRDLMTMSPVFRQPVRDAALKFSVLMDPDTISEFAACIEFAIEGVDNKTDIVREEYNEKGKAISKKDASNFCLLF